MNILPMVEMYSYLKSLFLCSLAKFVHLMALSLSLYLSLSLSFSLSLSLFLSLFLSFSLFLVMSLSLHHAQAQDLYEEKRSHESLAEKREKTRVKLELECAAARRGGGHYGY